MDQLVSVEHFKSLKSRADLRLAKLTLIYGPNSAGKSALMQSLTLLKQSFGRSENPYGLSLHGEELTLGHPETFFNNGDTSRPIIYNFFGRIHSLASRGSNKLSEHEKKYHWAGLTLRYKQDQEGNSLDPVNLQEVKIITLDINNNKSGDFTIKRQTASHELYFSLANEPSAKSLADFIISGQAEIRKNSADSTDPAELINALREARFGLTQENRYTFSRFGSARSLPTLELTRKPSINRRTSVIERDFLISAIWDSLYEPIGGVIKNIVHIGGLRSPPKRFYQLTGTPNYVGRDGEDFAGVLYNLSKQPGGIAALNVWLRRLEIPYSIDVAPQGDPLIGTQLIVKLSEKSGKVTVTPSDVGTGISQVLPLVIQGLAMDTKKSGFSKRFVWVEQPEIHLHPKLQANLADFFIESALKKKSAVNWIIETHSEALILRIQRRIREGKLNPNNVSINYVSRKTGTSSTIKELRLDDNGLFIDQWPDGFFEESYKERLGI